MIREAVEDAMSAGESKIPLDFVEFDNNSVDLGDHELFYAFLDEEEGDSEQSAIFIQKVTVVTKDGRKASRTYEQRAGESCKWTMYDNYERICRHLGIEPAGMD